MIENFKQHIYRDPEKKKEEDPEYTQEQLEQAEQIATEKLEKILNPDFEGFSVRYMNIEEYDEMIKNRKISGEFITHKEDSKTVFPLQEGVRGFLKNAKSKIYKTQWENHSGKAIKDIDGIIKEIRDENFLYKWLDIDEEKDVDRKTLIREYLLKEMETGKFNMRRSTNYIDPKKRLEKIDFLSQEQIQEIDDEFEKYYVGNSDERSKYRNFARKMLEKFDLTNDQKKILESYLYAREVELDLGKENLQTIDNFKKDPDFLDQKDGLRKIITALSNAHTVSASGPRQYYLAVVIDNNSFTFDKSRWSQEGWHELSHANTANMTKREIGKGILAAVSIYPLKDVYKEMIKLDKAAGDFAHPIFDSNGVVRFPSEKAGMNIRDVE